MPFPTRFLRFLAGISSCVYCIHAFCCELANRDKSCLAFLLVDRLLVAGLFPDRMYNQHISRNSCQFPAKSRFKAEYQHVYLLIFAITLPFCMRSNEMYGFAPAPPRGVRNHRLSTCCYAGSLFRGGFEWASNPYISFDLMHEGAVSGKTARRGVAAASASVRGGNNS